MQGDRQVEQLRAEVEELRQRLEEATATLDAIRNGEVDALVVAGADGERVFTLEGADHPYRVLIEAMQQGAATLSTDGTILFCNRCLADMLRAPQEKVSGSPLSRFVPPAELSRLESMLQEARTSHSVGEIRLRSGEDTLPVQLALSVLPLPGAAALGLIVTDLTEQKHQQELVAAHRRKDDFLAILAHELRNPLAPIRNALYLLGLPGTGNGVATQAREMIERQVGNLTRLVDDLLDVSRISRGKIQLRIEPLDLATLVRRAVEATLPFLESRRHTLSLALPPEPLGLEADPTRLEQVVVNLLNNAAKYTEPGGRIDVAAGREGDEVVLRIKDSGVGIAADLLPRVFELFIQADHSLDRTQGGLGIGLTLVRSLVRLHGGDITAHSDGPGRGSEFTVRLPLRSAPEPARGLPATPAAEGPRDGRCLRLLVVDDNRDAAESMGELLRLEGHRVEVFFNGTEALEAVPRFRPDVVLLDIGLPDLDGYQVAQRLRQLGSGAGTFLVAVTGYGQEEHRRQAAAAGFDCHLTKPVNLASLRDTLRQAETLTDGRTAD